LQELCKNNRLLQQALMTIFSLSSYTLSMKTKKNIFAALFAAFVILSACKNDSAKEIESNFIALLSAVRENDRETMLIYAPFMGEVTPEEEKSLIDFFTQIALEEKTIEAVPGGTRIKNLTVTLHQRGITFTFSFEKKNNTARLPFGGTWVLTKNVRVL
jgi:hypothetical protein